MIKRQAAVAILVVLLADSLWQTEGCATAMTSCVDSYNSAKNYAGNDLGRMCSAYSSFISCLSRVSCTGIYSSMQDQLDSLVKMGKDYEDQYCTGSGSIPKMSAMTLVLSLIIATFYRM